MLYRTCVRLLEKLTMLQSPSSINSDMLQSSDLKGTDIVTVAFNNIELIRWQTRLIRKYIQSPYTQIIVDNSTKKEARQQLQEFCKDNGLLYVGMPLNLLNRISPSYSHAMAVNYAYRRIIAYRKSSYFMLLDHDLFPIAPTNIDEIMCGKDVYGFKMDLDPKSWYLHPKVIILRSGTHRKFGVDFMPANYHGVYLDTGGSNWKRIYQYLSEDRCQWISHQLEPLRAGENWHSDTLEYLDGRRWLHTINGSCWKAIAGEDEKLQLIRERLANA